MKNKTIAILENRAGEQLADLVRKYGGTPFSAPALAEIPDIDPVLIAQLLKDWQSNIPDVFIFQTGVGVKAMFATTDALGMTEQLLQALASSVVAVRGTKPTAALRSRKVRIDLLASEPYTTTEVLITLDTLLLTGKHVVVQRYGDTNWELQRALEARGAHVTEITTYRWSLPENTKPMIDLMDALDADAIDVVCFTSASQVNNLFTVAQQLGRKEALQAGLNRSLVASIGPVCTMALTKVGVGVDIEPSPPKLGPFIDAINNKLSSSVSAIE
ncbi:MAG: uroporphyrinogen-III synthase [Methylotenera sp.]|nr:uroporphyrinogen-III synthase [Methylotenera sp.]MDP2281642.1 uroporphyrinogen-III synthase [Methylotenera sp.]MDP3060456.1 uroporphyrinogen-III synthase [Methylotenera sp.]